MCDTIFKKDIFFFFRIKTAGIRMRGGPRVEQDPTARYCGPRGSRAPAPPPHELPVPPAPRAARNCGTPSAFLLQEFGKLYQG